MDSYVLTEGACMRPLIIGGGAVFIDRKAPVKPGDIALYSIGAKTMLHRVWWADGARFWMKDDAGMVGLHAVDSTAILGRAAIGSIFGRGRLGLIFSLINTVFFMFARRIKNLLSPDL